VLRLLVSVGFQFFSLPSTGCFSSTCSRRLFAIGRQLVLSLGGWSPLLHAGFHVSDATRGSICPHGDFFRYRAITFSGRAFQSRSRKVAVWIDRWPHNPVRTRRHGRFGLIPVRSPLLRESRCFLFLELLRCFSSLRSPQDIYVFNIPLIEHYLYRVAPFGDLRI
jgi:hypothetical protein